jgi:hypothetical protein
LIYTTGRAPFLGEIEETLAFQMNDEGLIRRLEVF